MRPGAETGGIPLRPGSAWGHGSWKNKEASPSLQRRRALLTFEFRLLAELRENKFLLYRAAQSVVIRESGLSGLLLSPSRNILNNPTKWELLFPLNKTEVRWTFVDFASCTHPTILCNSSSVFPWEKCPFPLNTEW